MARKPSRKKRKTPTPTASSGGIVATENDPPVPPVPRMTVNKAIAASAAQVLLKSTRTRKNIKPTIGWAVFQEIKIPIPIAIPIPISTPPPRFALAVAHT